jgi:hypothetical protein
MILPLHTHGDEEYAREEVETEAELMEVRLTLRSLCLGVSLLTLFDLHGQTAPFMPSC